MIKKMWETCVKCNSVYSCYYNDFRRCHRIEAAADGLGVVVSPKPKTIDQSSVPFGVYMGLKHIIKKVCIDNGPMTSFDVLNTNLNKMIKEER